MGLIRGGLHTEVIHSSPFQSEDHKSLSSLASQIGVSKGAIEHLLWILNAPSSLTSFLRIVSNLREGLRLAETEIHADFLTLGMSEWPSILGLILEHRDLLLDKIGPHLSEYGGDQEGLSRRKHPLRGKGMVRHPMYTSMWNIHESNGDQDLYRLLQIHVLIAHAKLMQDRTSLEYYRKYAQEDPILGAFNSSASAACRLVRDLSLTAHQSWFNEPIEVAYSPRDPHLPARPRVSHGIKDFYTYFTTKHEDQKSDEQTACVKHLGLFFKRVYLEQETEDRKGGGKRLSVARTLHDGYVERFSDKLKIKTSFGDEDDPDHDWGDQLLIHAFIQQKEWEDMDLDPYENDTGEELYLSTYGEEKMRSTLSRYASAQGQVRQLAMANQLLRGRWSQMTVWEVSQLIRYCGDTFRSVTANNVISNKDKELLEAICLIMIMLWTGSDLDRARNISLIGANDRNAADLAYDLDKREWRVRPYEPTYATKPTQKQDELSRKKSEFVYLPDMFKIGGYLLQTAKHLNTAHLSGKVFNRRVDSYRKRIKAVLKELPDGARVSESKISKYLFFLIASEISGDVADAITTTASYHPLGQTTLHYNTPSADHIRRVYQEAVGAVVASIYSEAYDDKDAPERREPISLPGLHLGSRLCPETHRVASMVEGLATKIKSPPKNRLEPALIDYHNIYTIYTSQMIGYATGFRAVTNPFVHGSQIDGATSTAIISDKDGSDFYNSRVVWMPESVHQQMEHYMMHRTIMLNDVRLRRSDMQPEDTPYLFMLGKGLTVYPIRPKHVAPYLEDTFPMPLNVNRRYLRTELKERGCPIEVVNSFMGHWSRGEEPWGKYSSLSFDDFLDHIKQHIPDILTELKWQPIRSHILG